MQEVIKVEGLTKTYDKNLALNGLKLSVKRGMIFGMLGANGAGKSTAIECILGTRTADEGFVSILGMSPKKDRKKLFEHVGVQFQEANYQEKITVRELCEETACLYRNAADYITLLRQFGIEDKAHRLVSEISGGERQRLFIVLALIPNPDVVFLDELTTGLDARARRDVWQSLSALKANGLTILLTSHFMDEVEILCDEICILKHGQTVFQGTVEEAIRIGPYDKLEDAYLGFTDEGEEENEKV